MIKNYLKIALRGFYRDKTFTALNALSLMISLFVAYIGFSYVYFETNYDKFHTNSDDIYRLARTYRSQDYSVIGFPSWSDADAEQQQLQIKTLKDAPAVKDAVQFIISPNKEFLVSGNKRVEEKEILTTNTPAAFVNIFTWNIVNGSLKNFENGFQKAIITVSTAEKMFGKENLTNPSIINQPIQIGNQPFTLVAIITDVPKNSHFNFNLVLSNNRIDYWGSRIYIQKAENVSTKTAEDQINSAIASFNPRLTKDKLYKGHFLQSIADIHLNSNILYELKTPGNKNYIRLIGFFAVFILAITIFNYTNLSIAIKSKQAKSIGIHKAMGAKNTQVVYQFFWEGMILAIACLPFIAIMIRFGVPQFNTLMGVAIPSNILMEPKAMVLLTALAALISIVASLTPAIYFTLKDSGSLFKENLNTKLFQNMSFRKYLVVSQFVILITITSVSYFISKQLQFIENKDVGFKKEGIMYAYTSEENRSLFQEKLRQISAIQHVGNGSSFAIEPYNQLTYKLADDNTVFNDARELYLDPEAVKTYNLKTSLTTLPNTIITLINRNAAEKLAQHKKISLDELVGHTIITEPEYTNEETGQVGIPFVIAGIFDDINLFSLHKKIEPYFLTISPSVSLDGRSIISYEPSNETAVLEKINAVYSALNESIPLETEFLVLNVTKLYEQDRQTSDLLLYLNLIAVLLASLGIIGISIFLTIARTKEIGIRKVHGASVNSIIQSITKEYVFFVAIALLISWPLAYYTIKEWLSNFAYQIDITQFVFVIVGLFTFVWTSLIVGVIAYKAALVNPVESLKSE